MEKLVAFAPHAGKFTLRASASMAGVKLHFRFDLRDPECEVEGGPVGGLYTRIPRADGLWQRTCFEAFIAEEGSQAYWELNIAPDGSGWNLYHFDGYRVPQPPRASDDFALEKILVENGVLDCWLIPARNPAVIEVSLCAVVKTADSTHYLSAVHEAGKPDFHVRSSLRAMRPALP